MTRQDLRFAGLLAAVVVIAGLALGYVVGTLTRGDAARTAPPEGPLEFSAPQAEILHTADGGTVPGYADVYVNDYADLLEPSAEIRIRSSLIELYDNAGIEMTVLTLATMADYGHHGPVEPFATRLFNTWGIGNAQRNDGVLVLVVRDDRHMRIELGGGYESSWDARMQQVIDTAFLPAFREGAYQDGILRGVDDTIREIAGVYPGEYDSGPVRRGWSEILRWMQQLGGFALAILVPPVAGLFVWIRRYARRRPRPCAECGTMMLRAGEVADDEHLDGGQRLEEYLKSVDYDVWHCPDCGHIDIHGYHSWFSGYGACPQCDYRTMSTNSTVLKSATKTSTGTKRLDYECAHCGYYDSETRTIPKLSSSGSGSSRSSFGGGSSSGGGASGSW